MTENTPWGVAQDVEALAEGIRSYSTSTHGGIRLSPARQAMIPEGTKNFLNSREWWEEDCDWVVPYLLFRDDILAFGGDPLFDRNIEAARIIAARFHPEFTW